MRRKGHWQVHGKHFRLRRCKVRLENVYDCVDATHSVNTALVAVIHRGASVIYQYNSTPVEPWITATSAVMTTFVSSPLKQQ